MTIWPGLKPITIVFWLITVGIFVAAAAGQFVAGDPSAGVLGLAGPVVLYLFAWALIRFRPRPIRLDVTESVVRARQGRLRRELDKEMPRDQVHAIHYFPNLISFRGPRNETVMMIEPHYSLGQMRKVAAELGVRLYDHTRVLGLLMVDTGRLAYDPAPGDPASGVSLTLSRTSRVRKADDCMALGDASLRPYKRGQVSAMHNTGRPWWQTTRTVRQSYVFGGVWLLLGIGQLTLGLVPGGGSGGWWRVAVGGVFIFLGATYLTTGVMLRRYQRRTSAGGTVSGCTPRL